MNNNKGMTAVYVFFLVVVFLAGVQVGIHHGKTLSKPQIDQAYSDGWRDAHCGVGNSCESGDE